MTRGHNVKIHDAEECEGIRRAAAAAAGVRDALRVQVSPGMTTLDVDRLAGTLIRGTGGQSAFFNYHGFPGQICISLNDVVVHGIGDARTVIRPGDLLSIDVGVLLGGFYGDTALTFAVGSAPDDEGARLMTITRQSLDAGIEAARSGNRVNDIGRAVQRVVEAATFSVVRDFVGHGCGRELHEPPEVPNFSCRDPGPKLVPGMVLAIEPMVNAGGEKIYIEDDGWTVRTADGSRSAHFEHMVLIREGEAEILTWQKTQ